MNLVGKRTHATLNASFSQVRSHTHMCAHRSRRLETHSCVSSYLGECLAEGHKPWDFGINKENK